MPAVPAFLVELERPPRPRFLRMIRQIDGVAVATKMAIERRAVEGPAGARRLVVAGIEPLDFRSVAPPATRDAGFVWSSLIAGHGAITFEAARRIGMTRSTPTVEVADWGPLHIGAFADNGSPNVADVVVDLRLAREIGLGAPRAVVVGAQPDASVGDIAGTLEDRLARADVRKLVPQVPQVFPEEDPAPRGTAQGGLIGTMRFEILGGGFIKPDPAWVSANIVSATVPLLGEVTCHRLMVPQMRAALAEIEERGLGHLVDPGDYGGCYVPRFIGRDPARALSMHAFGLAFDVNVQTNWIGTRGDMDPEIVEIFERWGFEWGGRWSHPDPMHFELDTLVRAG